MAPGDEDAIRCKVVALIKADRINDALSTIQSTKKVPIDFTFFKVRNFKHLYHYYEIILNLILCQSLSLLEIRSTLHLHTLIGEFSYQNALEKFNH